MAYLIGIPVSWFLPGLLCGIERLSKSVLRTAVLVEPTTLRGVVGRERPVNSLAPFAKLVGTFSGPPPCARFPFLGTCSASLVAAATLALLARAASCLFTSRKWEV